MEKKTANRHEGRGWGRFRTRRATQISIAVALSYFCGGLSPTSGANQSLTFDLKSGKEVPFEALFAHYDDNKRALLSEIFARQLHRARRRPTAKACATTHAVR